MKPTIYFVVGPTACGKTAVSIELAKRMDAEIISADSIQVYRTMNIGSAKPSLEERQGIPHHMIDVVEINTPSFSVSEYRNMAITCIKGILRRGKKPLIVGGTGLYINALTFPLSFAPASSDETVRMGLQAQEQTEKGSLYERLKLVDPKSADRLHRNDLKRIIRALEVYELTGQPLSSFGASFSAPDGSIPYDVRIAGLNILPREALYERIDRRVDRMLQDGLLHEVITIREYGYPKELPALQGLGYAQLLRYLNGEYALEDAIAEIKQKTRNFAKRQLTWFKRDQRIRWHNGADYTDIQMLADDILKGYFDE